MPETKSHWDLIWKHILWVSRLTYFNKGQLTLQKSQYHYIFLVLKKIRFKNSKFYIELNYKYIYSNVETKLLFENICRETRCWFFISFESRIYFVKNLLAINFYKIEWCHLLKILRTYWVMSTWWVRKKSL